jgi:hypothetical protein
MQAPDKVIATLQDSMDDTDSLAPTIAKRMIWGCA